MARAGTSLSRFGDECSGWPGFLASEEESGHEEALRASSDEEHGGPSPPDPWAIAAAWRPLDGRPGYLAPGLIAPDIYDVLGFLDHLVGAQPSPATDGNRRASPCRAATEHPV